MRKMTRKTKIIATAGPACHRPAELKELLRAGANILRLNTSHMVPSDVRAWFSLRKRLERDLERRVPLLLDLQGPRIRTGPLRAKKMVLQTGDEVSISVETGAGHGHKITTNCHEFTEMVKKGDPVLLDNGMVELEVKGRNRHRVICRVVNGGVLGENKGINLPRAPLTLPALTDKDRNMVALAAELGADYVALSFVRTGGDVHVVRELLESAGARIPVIAKIEKPMALDHIPEILSVSDGLMVARGDLGIELGVEKIPVIQKKLIWMANRNRVPVITATQMLESMMNHPRPLRAEVSDVANAVFDGTDMVMLSGETAIGQYPVETVRFMDRIIREAEAFHRFPASELTVRPDSGFSR